MIYIVLWIIMFSFLSRKEKHLKTLYCAICGIPLAFMSAFRASTVGTDSLSYANGFVSTQPLTMDGLREIFQEREPLYYTLTSFLRLFTDNYTVLFTVIAIFFVTVVCFFIRKYSKNPTISFIIFLSMGYFSFSMAGLRQTLAMGFMILALDKLIRKKYISFFALVAIATGFHITSLIYLIVIIVYFVPLNSVYIIGTVVASAIFYIGGYDLIEPIANFIWGDARDYDMEYGGISTLILLIIVAIASLIFYKGMFKYHKVRKISKEYNLEINSLFLKMLFLSIPFQVMAIYQAHAFRLAMLFHLPIMILIPNVLKSQKNIYVRYIGTIVVILALLYQLFMITSNSAGINPYTFFWQA